MQCFFWKQCTFEFLLSSSAEFLTKSAKLGQMKMVRARLDHPWEVQLRGCDFGSAWKLKLKKKTIFEQLVKKVFWRTKNDCLTWNWAGLLFLLFFCHFWPISTRLTNPLPAALQAVGQGLNFVDGKGVQGWKRLLLRKGCWLADPPYTRNEVPLQFFPHIFCIFSTIFSKGGHLRWSKVFCDWFWQVQGGLICRLFFMFEAHSPSRGIDCPRWSQECLWGGALICCLRNPNPPKTVKVDVMTFIPPQWQSSPR